MQNQSQINFVKTPLRIRVSRFQMITADSNVGYLTSIIWNLVRKEFAS